MMVVVRVPSVLRDMAGGRSRIETELADSSATLADLWHELGEHHPGLRDRVLDQHGAIRPHVNVFVNSVSARESGGDATLLTDGDEVWILAAVSGG